MKGVKAQTERKKETAENNRLLGTCCCLKGKTIQFCYLEIQMQVPCYHPCVVIPTQQVLNLRNYIRQNNINKSGNSKM